MSHTSAHFCAGPRPTKERDLEAEIKQHWKEQQAKAAKKTK